ncbi:hypothetical protein EYF80_008035 [Liparis tanakae]|uniref:Uncharacterized protein n=1 Tax=Liparis tanakae TaxID=230148 RepID=A0A4Z2IUA2_9TELE|nr:hypothetical protein EYF80_008035 [Liparis tanakae]
MGTAQRSREETTLLASPHKKGLRYNGHFQKKSGIKQCKTMPCMDPNMAAKGCCGHSIRGQPLKAPAMPTDHDAWRGNKLPSKHACHQAANEYTRPARMFTQFMWIPQSANSPASPSGTRERADGLKIESVVCCGSKPEDFQPSPIGLKRDQ